MHTIPANTVPNKLLVKIATAITGNEATILREFSYIANLSSVNKIDWANNAAITATGTCFNQRIAQSGNCILLKTIRGRTLGIKVTSADPTIINRIV